MDLYSIEKTKDYAFFKFVSWYYQLTPRVIKIIKFIIFLLLFLSFFCLNHFTKDKITLYVYIIVAINFVILLYLMEILIQMLAKGTGNERMIEMSNSIKECMDAFLLMIFHSMVKIILISTLIYLIMLLLLNPTYQKNLSVLLGNKILPILSVLMFFFGCLITYLIYYFSLWLSSIGIIRASSHILKCYNEYAKFIYKISFIISTFAVTTNIIFMGLFFILIYFLMYFSDEGYFMYPYEKTSFIMVSYFFGAAIVNVYVNVTGNIYAKTSSNCFDLKEKINYFFQNNFKNPIYISSLIGENIKNTIVLINNNILFLSGLMIVMFISSSISDKSNSVMKENNIKNKVFLFPLSVYTLNLLLEVFRIFFIKTKVGLPKGGTEYQEIESILQVFSKWGLFFRILKIIGFSVLSFLFFSKNRRLYELKNDLLWVNCILCFLIGEINFKLIHYFTKKYTDKSSNPIKFLLTLTQGGFLDNILGGSLNGIESSLFPCVLISFSLIGAYNLGIKLNLYLNFEAIKKQLGFFFISLVMLSLQLKVFFINTVYQAKTVLFLTDEIIRSTANEITIQNISEESFKQNESYLFSAKGIVTANSFYTSFLLIKSIEYIHSNLSSHEIKIDLGQTENFISCFFGIIIVHCITSGFIEIILKTTQIGLKSLSTIFTSAATTSNIVERTQLDYRHCVWALTQTSMKSIYKLSFVIFTSPILLYFSFKFIGSFFQLNNSLGIQALICFIFFALGYSIICEFCLNNAGISWINTHQMIKDGLAGSSFEDLEEITKIGKDIGKYSEGYVSESLNSILLFIIFECMFFIPFSV